jgi:predicted DNA-binding transcriptional regulator YafY
MRTFERDKDELRALGLPIEVRKNNEGEELGYILDPREVYLPYISLAGAARAKAQGTRRGYRSVPPLIFEPDELQAVLQAARLARNLADPLLTEQSDSATRKLTFDLPNVTHPDGDDTLRQSPRNGDRAALRELGNALLRRKRVTFTYHTIGTDLTTKRTVEPFGLFFQSGHWYVAGRDAGKDIVRNFRVSRIADVKVNAGTARTADYDIPKNFRLSDHAHSRKAWEVGDGDAEEAVVEFRRATGVAKAAASHGAVIRGSPRQRRFQVRRQDVFVRWLLSFAGDAIPVSPPALVQSFREVVRQTLALYDGVN